MNAKFSHVVRYWNNIDTLKFNNIIDISNYKTFETIKYFDKIMNLTGASLVRTFNEEDIFVIAIILDYSNDTETINMVYHLENYNFLQIDGKFCDSLIQNFMKLNFWGNIKNK